MMTRIALILGLSALAGLYIGALTVKAAANVTHDLIMMEAEHG